MDLMDKIKNVLKGSSGTVVHGDMVGGTSNIVTDGDLSISGNNVYINGSKVNGKTVCPSIEEKRVLASDFDTLTIKVPVNITLNHSDSREVLFKGPKEALDKIHLKLHYGQLEIEPKGSYSGYVEINISSVLLKEINCESAAKVSGMISNDKIVLNVSEAGEIFLDCQSKEVDASISGAGEIKIKGKTEMLFVDVSGAGEFKGSKLYTESADVKISGAGNATINAQKTVSGKVSGAGCLECGGEATVDVRSSGAGHVRKP